MPPDIVGREHIPLPISVFTISKAASKPLVSTAVSSCLRMSSLVDGADVPVAVGNWSAALSRTVLLPLDFFVIFPRD